jgi:hypothetical protein
MLAVIVTNITGIILLTIMRLAKPVFPSASLASAPTFAEKYPKSLGVRHMMKKTAENVSWKEASHSE